MATGMHEEKIPRQTAYDPSAVLIIILSFLAGLFLNGNIPGLSLSTLGQALVVLGYPISFMHEQGFNIYTQHIGFPNESPMSTMLAPALLMHPFLSVGFSPQDGFASAFIIFYVLGFFGFYKLARRESASPAASALISALWSACPIVWNSSAYAHLHFGLIALPFFYYLCTVGINLVAKGRYSGAIPHVLSTITSVFTDGYTFVFLALASSIYIATHAVQMRPIKKAYCAITLHATSLLLSYFLFISYVGVSEYEVASLDFFRGWGADLSFLIIPTEGHHWLWDTLGLSLARSPEVYYGDWSVWISTFSAPLILITIVLIRKIHAKSLPSFCYISIAVIGLYMSLGPSLKINALKPAGYTELGMAVEHAGIPTGSAVLSEHVPGLKNMRASYRWITLFYFGSLGIIAIYSGRTRTKNGLLILIALIVLFIPDPKSHWASKTEYRATFLDIDRRLLDVMKKDLKAGEVVAFLPWGNDFLINYLAPSLDIRTFNVGGDKNVTEARKHWPDNMLLIPRGTIPPYFVRSVLSLLIDGDADAVILTYIDYLKSSEFWPPKIVHKERLAPYIRNLKNIPGVSVNERQYYSIVRLTDRDINIDAVDLSSLPRFSVEVHAAKDSPRTTGVFQNGVIRSEGRQGFLHYGPYSAARSGEYALEVFGRAGSTPTAWVDVVSQLGTVTHGHFPLISNKGSEHSTLLRSRIHIPTFVQDLEVRVYVDTEDELELGGIKLQLLK